VSDYLPQEDHILSGLLSSGILKMNPHHDERGRFAFADGSKKSPDFSRDPEVTTAHTQEFIEREYDKIPKREREKSNAVHIRVYDNPEDVYTEAIRLGHDPEIDPESGVVRGFYDFNTKTIHASTWDGEKDTARNFYHEFAHSIVGRSEEAAESWVSAYYKAKKQDSLLLQLIAKDDSEQIIPGYHYVEGVVYAPLEVDVDGEVMTAHDVKLAAFSFIGSGRTDKIDISHDNETCEALAVTSYLARKDDPDGYPEGGWILGCLVPEGKVWEAIKSGELNGYSLQAWVQKVPRTLPIDLVKIATGKTDYNSGTGPHQHDFYVEFNSLGRVTLGSTGKTNGHNHQIRGTVVTEDAAGHNHRWEVGRELTFDAKKMNLHHDELGRFARASSGSKMPPPSKEVLSNTMLLNYKELTEGMSKEARYAWMDQVMDDPINAGKSVGADIYGNIPPKGIRGDDGGDQNKLTKLGTEITNEYRATVEEDGKLQAAMMTYTSGHYTGINGALRNKTGEYSDVIEKLDILINKTSLPYDTKVYRGAKISDVDSLVGKTISDLGYVSTTVGLNQAAHFAAKSYQNSVIFEFVLNRGSKALYTGNSEYEFVLPRGSKFKITGYGEPYGPNKIPRLIAEVIYG